jgi:hypothetical protein
MPEGQPQMIMASDETTASPAGAAYERPTLVVIGSVEAITLSSTVGSFTDGHGRSNKKG